MQIEDNKDNTDKDKDKDKDKTTKGHITYKQLLFCELGVPVG